MQKSLHFLSYSILLISVYSVLQWSSLSMTIFNNTFCWWFLQALILYNFYKYRNYKAKEKVLSLFLVYVVLSFLYGLYMAENYWHYKFLVRNLMIYLMPLSIYVFVYPLHVQTVLRVWFKKALIILICISPFIYSDAWGNYLTPFCLFALFYHLLPQKWRYITILAFIVTFTLGWASRSCTIRFSVAFIIGILFMWKSSRNILLKHLKIIYIVFSLIPIVFFILATTNVFNILNIDEELGLSQKYEMFQSDKEANGSALADTRTSVYIEVLNSALQNHYVTQGHSLARGYESVIFNDVINESSDGLLNGERPGCETCILNVFTYMGIIGVILYMLIFLRSTFLAISRSNNSYIKIVALFVLFRWIYSWIEELAFFNITYLMLWIMVAMCFSPYFRRMTNEEFKWWFKTILK